MRFKHRLLRFVKSKAISHKIYILAFKKDEINELVEYISSANDVRDSYLKGKN
jgi:hypothetical protein